MKTRLPLLLASIILTAGMLNGCAVVLHPIEKVDIFRMKSGQSYTSEKDGWFLSDLYMQEIAKAKVK